MCLARRRIASNQRAVRHHGIHHVTKAMHELAPRSIGLTTPVLSDLHICAIQENSNGRIAKGVEQINRLRLEVLKQHSGDFSGIAHGVVTYLKISLKTKN